MNKDKIINYVDTMLEDEVMQDIHKFELLVEWEQKLNQKMMTTVLHAQEVFDCAHVTAHIQVKMKMLKERMQHELG